MCTAVRRGGFFGRTLDLEYSYEEQIVVTPRNFPMTFHGAEPSAAAYAMIGVAYVAEGIPLYYDAANEKGLAMAGLNFPGNAVYGQPVPGRCNVAPWELIPWVLRQCASVDEAEALLCRTNPVCRPFSASLPLTPLHWMVADGVRSIVVEPMADGLRIWEDPADVMTNNPPFPLQLERAEPQESRGLGALGLPGDWSSSSRFERAAFVNRHALSGGLGQFFRVLGAVEVPEGCIRLTDGKTVRTVYTSGYDLERGLCCTTTCTDRRIVGVDMHREQLDGSVLSCYPVNREEEILIVN